MTDKPWYKDGLRFTCTQCGNCCTGGPGYVWISRPEIDRLAQFLKLTPQQTIERYCRKIGDRFSLTETRGAAGAWDCIFLRDEPVHDKSGKVVQTKRVCSIYPARPGQCRSWPFWDSNLSSPESWNRAAHRCYGMNQGRLHSRREIEANREQDARRD